MRRKWVRRWRSTGPGAKVNAEDRTRTLHYRFHGPINLFLTESLQRLRALLKLKVFEASPIQAEEINENETKHTDSRGAGVLRSHWSALGAPQLCFSVCFYR